MANIQNIFKRIELKYLISDEQKNDLITEMNKHMCPDEYGKSTICNLYYDTPDHTIIRRSLEGPVYKEKLRLRSYGQANANSITFIELKKKYQGVVYKRRVTMTESLAVDFLSGKRQTDQSIQMIREIDYFLHHYQSVSPKMFIAYDRTAFNAKNDPSLRVTFDENILWRTTDLDLKAQVYGEPLLMMNQSLLEIKTAFALPLWLTHKLNELKIYKISFSKYGNAYKAQVGELSNVVRPEVIPYSKEKNREFKVPILIQSAS